MDNAKYIIREELREYFSEKIEEGIDIVADILYSNIDINSKNRKGETLLQLCSRRPLVRRSGNIINQENVLIENIMVTIYNFCRKNTSLDKTEHFIKELVLLKN